MATTILFIILAFIAGEFLFTKWLAWLNLRTWSKPMPEEVKDLYDAEKYARAKSYAEANFSLSLWSAVLATAVSMAFLYFGGFAWLDEVARGYTENYILQSLIFFAILGAGSFLMGLPFEWYRTFVIEEKYGFNRMTMGLYISDKIKGILLGAVIGGAILSLLNLLFHLLGGWFWIGGWALVTAVSVFFAMFYTTLLLPLFNKLVPLEAGPLRSAIENYASKVRFPLTNIFVMDGSKRSSKANAFFSGLGHKKDIVLFDNLVNEMTVEEITAVLAHEVGHYKHKHVAKNMVASVLQIGLLFFLFGWLAGSPLMAEVLGARENSFHLALVTFSLLYSPVSLLIGIGMHQLSRKFEYEADAYARDTYAAQPLIDSLKKLSVNHLSNLQPHPAYVFVNYSHPTLLQRIRAMKSS